MGFDAGFDMVPRLSRGTEDAQLWARFIDAVKERYKNDPEVEVTANYILFKVGENPSLPLAGHKFLRFSSKVSGSSKSRAKSYIDNVARSAKAVFGARIQSWNEGGGQFGHYEWSEVHKSIRSYDEVDKPLFQVKKLPGKGRGLVACAAIPKGTRILCEKPLLTVQVVPPEEMEMVLNAMLKTMDKDQQREFLSLHNNFPGKHPFGGIVKTNGLPCGTDSTVGGVYPTICLINHSCVPNCYSNWNAQARHETIHAIRRIKRGEEITISYDVGGVRAIRQAFLKNCYGFDCQCSACLLPPEKLRDSNTRRFVIQHLSESIADGLRMSTSPEDCLHDCHALLQALRAEYICHPGAHLCSMYYNAFHICIAHGDLARAGVFAAMAYDARVCAEGEDSPETQRMKALSVKPDSHQSYGACSMDWKTKRSMVPKNLDQALFELWLFGYPKSDVWTMNGRSIL